MRRDPSLIPLSHQHHNALALCVLTDRALARTPPPPLSNLADRIVSRFDIEIRNHFELEEQLLFPPLAGLPEVSALVGELLGEHRQLESAVAGFREGKVSPALLEAFTGMLRAHVRKEENVLFAKAQQLLPPDVLNRIGTELEARAVRVVLE